METLEDHDGMSDEAFQTRGADPNQMWAARRALVTTGHTDNERNQRIKALCRTMSR